MFAPEKYLADLRSKYDAHEWALSLVPRDGAGGGTNLQKLPPELAKQSKTLDDSESLSPIEILVKLSRDVDWLSLPYRKVLPLLDEKDRKKVERGPTFAIGTRPAMNVNAQALPVPPDYGGSGWVLVFDSGLFHLIGGISRLLSLKIPDQRTTIMRSAKDVLGWVDPPEYHSLWPQAVKHYQSRFPSRTDYDLGFELWFAVKHYCELGVVQYPSLPEISVLPPYPDSIGHPAESSAFLSEIAVQFVILHEIGHVALDHMPLATADSTRSQSEELIADEWALRTAVLPRVEKRLSITAPFAGAVFVHSLLACIEDTQGAGDAGSHPPARTRRAKLFENLCALGAERGFDTEPARAVGQAVADAIDSLWMQSEQFRMYPPNLTYNSFTSFLEDVARENKPLWFMDQIPRWLAWGAPRQLCRIIAHTKVMLERGLRHGELHRREVERAKLKLALINWVYDSAPDDSWAREYLGKCYKEFLNG